MVKNIFNLLIVLLTFTGSVYADELPKDIPTEVATDAELKVFYDAVQDELELQEGRIAALAAQLSAHREIPSDIIFAQYKLAISMLDVKETLAGNFYHSTCLNYDHFRQSFLKILCKEVITHIDLLELQMLANIYRKKD
ncbi:MAG: hypothetical protein WC222_03155 [Parachlamydiales bacterium]|jgi:hypothetical protein